MDQRAERERERYNAGLQRDSYDRLLNPSKEYFMAQRRALALRQFSKFPKPVVLELGSTTWRQWIELNGLVIDDLTCINVSEAELDQGRLKAAESRNKPKFMLMDAQSLQFPDGHFDVVFGSAILHHLDFEKALKEIKRVLKPSGVMFFAEPIDINPVGRIIRSLTPAARTEDERPFRMREFRLLDTHYDCEYHFKGLVSVPVGVLTAMLRLPAKNPVSGAAYLLDRALAQVPGLRYLCRHVFLEGRPKRA